jgi:4-hydroxy-2-oxoheptanedioate aldolase
MNVHDMKARLKAGQPVFGTWCHLCNPTVVEIVGASGLDFIVIDMEHGPHSFAELPGLLAAAELSGLTPVTRVPSDGNSNILRVLDSGCKGVMVPHVEDARAAAACLDSMRYGSTSRNRGVATLTRASMFDYENEAGHFERQNAQVLTVLMVEDKTALDELDAICALPGLDVVFLGIYDLSQSLGMRGAFDNPEFQAVFRDAVRRIAGHGVAVGCYAPTAAAANALVDQGITFVTIGVDGAVLRRAYRGIVAEVSGRPPAGPSPAGPSPAGPSPAGRP